MLSVRLAILMCHGFRQIPFVRSAQIGAKELILVTGRPKVLKSPGNQHLTTLKWLMTTAFIELRDYRKILWRIT